jgi:hypothetical protein
MEINNYMAENNTEDEYIETPNLGSANPSDQYKFIIDRPIHEILLDY